MPVIVPIVEGDGEVQAVPVLLSRMLQYKHYWNWRPAPPKRAGGLQSLRPKLDKFLRLATLERNCGAILILLDLDDGCPLTEVQQLVTEVRACHLSVPVAIVFAYREYEAWFLASLQTIAGHCNLPAGLTYQGDVEGRRGVKEWLSGQMPKGKAYKETIDQVNMTRLIDFELAHQQSRSFRRLDHAVTELVEAAEQDIQDSITPYLR